MDNSCPASFIVETLDVRTPSGIFRERKASLGRSWLSEDRRRRFISRNYLGDQFKDFGGWESTTQSRWETMGGWDESRRRTRWDYAAEQEGYNEFCYLQEYNGFRKDHETDLPKWELKGNWTHLVDNRLARFLTTLKYELVWDRKLSLELEEDEQELVFDEYEQVRMLEDTTTRGQEPNRQKCIIMGRETLASELDDEQKYYVLVVAKICSQKYCRKYERVGVGIVRKSHVLWVSQL
ncbi:hypothetical protein BBP40_008385 [Aspergillus hancockii]|nr:hypothetical protein BBP40_008385 [Aspergillus hancockii]